jgi:hypothetical protein
LELAGQLDLPVYGFRGDAHDLHRRLCREGRGGKNQRHD